MLKLKYFFQKNKILIMISLIILICSIAIAFGVYAQITGKGIDTTKNQEIQNDYIDLEENFRDIFTNSINKEATANLNINYEELLYCRYTVKEENDKYNIDAKIPEFKGESETIKNINNEIFNTFAKKVVDISKNESERIAYNVDYVAYVNGNVVSLIIMCKYKEGATPQRQIVQTYNYDAKNDKILNIQDIIDYKNLDKDQMQKKVENKIKEKNIQNKNISEQGLNIYIRDEKSEIYKVENTPNFFLGKNNYLYLVYAYGNNHYTGDIDLVIF